MDTRVLGPLTVSGIGLGCNNFGRPGFVTEDLAGTRAVLGACLDHGVSFLDTAALYGAGGSESELLMGEALEGMRDQVVLATKWGHTAGPEPAEWGARGSAGFVRRACEASLRRLRTDRIDLFQLHEPDPSTPVTETLGELAALAREGKILAYGHSNFTPEQVREADAAAVELGVEPFVSAQNQYSLVHRDPEAELIPVLDELGLGLLPFFPLHMGLLTGKYQHGQAAPTGTRLATLPDRMAQITGTQWAAVDRYRAFCDQLGTPMTDTTLAWMLAQKTVASVIAGATRPDQVASNAGAAELGLAPDVVAAISEIFAGL